jgi:hypothetical protein
MATEGIEVRSVGNTLTLHETALVEAAQLGLVESKEGTCDYSLFSNEICSYINISYIFGKLKN